MRPPRGSGQHRLHPAQRGAPLQERRRHHGTHDGLEPAGWARPLPQSDLRARRRRRFHQREGDGDQQDFRYPLPCRALTAPRCPRPAVLHETAQLHRTPGHGGSRLPARSARAGAGDAGDRIPRRFVARGPQAIAGRLPAGAGRSRLCRTPERRHRVPLGRGSIRSPAGDSGGAGAPASHRPRRRRRPFALAAKAATTTIPIVFMTGIEPVQGSLILSLSRPGGNLTGFNLIAGPLPAKQLGLLHELVPAAKVIAVLINPNNANAERDAATVQDAASKIGVHILVARAIAESDFETVFATLARERAEALLINSDVFFTSRRDQILALAARHALPFMSAWREFPLAGGLISYGPSIAAAYREIGLYTGKILKGAKPADLPVVQPTTFELVINLKTAKTLGLTVPLTLEVAADEVIE